MHWALTGNASATELIKANKDKTAILRMDRIFITNPPIKQLTQ